ncbi:hypothetical protein BDZ91DRAFT_661694 [Kalaharituber pfeilii]|nr:hypothetical protein BDZ91DRAFT_661694 [Kalaharituber pfeilii]
MARNKKQLAGNLVWNGDELTEDIYVFMLNDTDIQELESAMRHFVALDKKWGHINQSTFPLPVLGPILRQRSREIHYEYGLLIVRGLTPSNYTSEQFMILHAGISSWIGSQRAVQNGNTSREMNVALHITDHDLQKIRAQDPNLFVPSSNTNAAMPFHTDSGDIISLAYVQLSQTGGQVRVASSGTVINTLQQENPKVIETLRQPWPWHMVGNNPEAAYHGLLHDTMGKDGLPKMILMSERRPFFGDEKCARPKWLPELSGEQKYALEAIERVASRCCHTIKLEVGDIFFLNNLAVLHARSSYVDSSQDPASKRHAIRIVLRDWQNGWDIPPALHQRYHTMFSRNTHPDEEGWQVTPHIWGNDSQHG